jgi:hypothetical protein
MLERVLRNVATELDIGPAAAPSRRDRRSAHSWLRQPLFAAVAATLILFAAGTLHTVSAAPQSPVMSLAPAAEPSRVLHRLADLAAAAPPRDSEQLSRHEITINSQPSSCTAESMLVQILASPVVARPQPQPGKLSILAIDPPALITDLAGCDKVRPLWAQAEPVQLSAEDLAATWQQRAEASNSSFFARWRYPDARTLGGRTDITDIEATPDGVAAAIDTLLPFGQPDSTERVAHWWQLWTELVGSPLCTPLLRSAALRAGAQRAASTDEVTVAASDTAEGSTDLQGQAGITLQVPGRVADQDTLVELSFDFVRGELTQRVSVIGDGPKKRWMITLYLPDDRPWPTTTTLRSTP